MARTTCTAVCFELLLTIAFSGYSSACYAFTIVLEDTLVIRVDNTDVAVTFTATWINYAASENCGNGAHRTADGDPRRYFAHAHVNYTLPKTGLGDDMQEYEVNNTGIKAFWDYYYGQESDGGEDHTYNCWAYALGFTTCWIQDPEFIYQDDYVDADMTDIEIDDIDDHVIKVTDRCENESNTTIRQTMEKNQPSGVYTFDYYCPAGKASEGTKYKVN